MSDTHDVSDRVKRLSADQRAALAARLRERSAQPARDAIAIVGMSCRFPGADSPDAFWEVTERGADLITEVPEERWPARDLFDPSHAAAGKISTRWGGFVRGADRFDAAFFGISPREAQQMDPQQRLLLEVAWEALDDAGVDVERLGGTRTGVFVGLHSYSSDYLWMQLDRPDQFDQYTGTGSAHNIVAGRLSYLWDLRGPAVVVDTACSSSLVAVHLACRSLQDRESDLVIAGGVNLILTPLFTVAVSRMQMFSPDGRCKAFDARGDGFVRSEGCGVVVLKRLADAEASGDRILAVIRGSAMNQDGRTNGITAPSSHSQQDVITQALAQGGIEPDSIGYIEAHGTGTALGDPIEAEALGAVFRGPRPSGLPCVLGSVKANIGHLEGAAGIAGLIKAVLTLRHRTYPPLALFERLNPHITLEGTALEIPTAARPWEQAGTPRRAGVSSFGWSGTNAHIVLEEAPALQPATESAADRTTCVLPLSARSDVALRDLARAMRESLASGALREAELRDVVFTASRRRSHHDYRAAVCADSRQELADALECLSKDERRWDIAVRRAVAGRRPQVAFVFCGQGPQAAGMGMDLFGAADAFTASLNEIEALIRRHAGWSLLDVLRAPETQSQLASTEFAQPALFALQVALAAEWRSRGIVPGAVVGHSVGEIAAAHVSGALTLEDAVRIVVHRARLMQRATGKGRMLSVPMTAKDAEDLAAPFGGHLSLAAENAPRSCVLSGDTAAVMQVAQMLEQRGVAARLLPVNYAFHSRQMEPILRELRDALRGITSRTPSIPLVSTVTGKAVTTELGPDYWASNVRQTVRLSAAVRTLCPAGRNIFVEIGPHPVLAPSIAEIGAGTDAEVITVATLQRARPGSRCLQAALGQLYTAGAAIDWSRIHPGPARVASLPAYPWQRQRYWLSQPGHVRAERTHDAAALPGTRLRSPLFDSVVFEASLGSQDPAYLADHRIGPDAVCPASMYVALALAAGREALGRESVELRDVLVHQPLVLPEGGARTSVQTILRRDGETLRFEICALQSEQSGEWATHATGIVAAVDPECVVTGPGHHAEAADGIRLDPAVHYDGFEPRGLTFGHAFRCIDELVQCSSDAFASLSLPPQAGDAPGTPIHPVLLDGAFHAAWASMPPELVEHVAYLPFSIERVRVTGHAADHVEVHGRRRMRIPAGGETLASDITIRNANREVVAEISGFTLKRMGADQAEQGRRRVVRNWFYEATWLTAPAAPPASLEGHWLIVGDAVHAAGAQAEIVKRGGTATIVAPGPASAGECGAVLRKREEHLRGIVLFADANARPVDDTTSLLGAQASACAAVTSIVHAMVAASTPPLPPLWVITTGAELVVEAPALVAHWNAAHAPVPGLLRALRMELPELRCTAVDFEPGVPVDRQASLLAAELARPAAAAECEVAFRGGNAMVRRLAKAAADAPKTPAAAPAGAVRLHIATKGVLDNLGLVPLVRHEPADHEVEIEVKASGLNFRDVLNALGMYPGEAGALGSECAGTVVAVGRAVTNLKLGDEVMAVGEGTIGSYVTTDARLAVRKPAALTFAEAATVPIAFLTVYESLFARAALRAGDRVLIHAGAGGVGLAAIQMAMKAGAVVYATAGSPHKREFLKSLGVEHVMDSRSLNFARELIDATGGAGVDVVLNSLNGEFIERSLAVLAPNGRFVELGKIGIWSDEQVAKFRPDVAYHVVYLGDYFHADPAYIQDALTQLAARFADGDLDPLPLTVFGFDEAAVAFRHMAQAHHIGKIALTPAARTASRIRADGAYLITGGTGALGLAIADWMVASGARRLVLVSRRPPTAAQQARVDRLTKHGARVDVAQCDVSERADLVRLVHDVNSSGPMLRGIVHAAGVLDDGVALQMTKERFASVLAAKAAGAVHLAELSRHLPLDFLAFFSSLASLLGSPGQSNYAAANAFLDTLARRLRMDGLPAVSIGWGPWLEGGMAAGTGERQQQRWAAQGLSGISNEDGARAFDMAVQADLPHVGVARVNWELYGSQPQAASLRALLSGFVERRVEAAPPPASASSLFERLRRKPASQRRTMLQQHVRERALKVLGLPGSYPLDAHQGLRDVGLDSLLAIELRNALQTDAEASLPATLAFDYPTVDALTGFLSDGPFAAVFGAPQPVAAAPASDLAEMSDEEAAALLMNELSALQDTPRA